MRRRTFFQTGIAACLPATLAGCSDDSDTGTETDTATNTETETPTETETDTATTTGEEETPTEHKTEEEPAVDRPTNYRWDITSGRNDEIRRRLGQHVDGSVGEAVQNHPAFEFSTERDTDDHTVDFAGLKLYRDATYDLIESEPRIVLSRDRRPVPLEKRVEAYVDEDLFTDAKTGNRFVQHDLNAPTEYSVDGWLNADTVADSLDYGHNLAIAIVDEAGKRNLNTVRNNAAVIREAYKRHHDFDVLAWTTRMGDSNSAVVNDPTGLLYSPDDDTLRNFNFDGDEGDGETSLQLHAPIEEWEELHKNDGTWARFTDNEFRFHPLLLHKGWARSGQASDFEGAKGFTTVTVRRIASGPTDASVNRAHDRNYVLTTGLAKQLSRTLFEYNDNEADFADIWNLASVMEHLGGMDGHYVFDTAEQNDDYSRVFDGNFAVYEIGRVSELNGDPGLTSWCEQTWDNLQPDERPAREEHRLTCFFRQIRKDENGDYDNFGQLYDGLETAN